MPLTARAVCRIRWYASVCVCGGSHLLKMFLGELGFKGVCTAVSQGGKTYTYSVLALGGDQNPMSTVPETPQHAALCSPQQLSDLFKPTRPRL